MAGRAVSWDTGKAHWSIVTIKDCSEVLMDRRGKENGYTSENGEG